MKHYIPHPGQIEIHLGGSPEFSRYSKKVKALGGKYTECRGHSHTRFVDLPFTDEGRELANRLVALFGKPKTTIVVRGIPRDFRGKYIHAPVVVHYISKTSADPCQGLLDSYESAFLRAFPDALWPEPVVAPAPKPLRDVLSLDSAVKFHAVLEALQQFIDNGRDAEELYDVDEAKLEAAEELRDQLDATLASLAG